MTTPSERSFRRRLTTGPVLAVIGVLAGVIGAIATIIQSCPPPPPPKCGESSFLGLATYNKYSEKNSSNQLKTESLYNSGEPKDAGDVFIESSPELTALSQALRNQQTFAPSQMIFLYGPGGAGKSAVVDRLKSAPSTAFIDVGRQFAYVAATDTVHKKTDLRYQLTIHNQVISKMPDLKDEVFADGLDSLFKAGGVGASLSESKNIIIDSLDELHPVSSARIIETARTFVLAHPDKNVLLAGRGETFRTYFEQQSYSSKNFKPLHLKPR